MSSPNNQAWRGRDGIARVVASTGLAVGVMLSSAMGQVAQALPVVPFGGEVNPSNHLGRNIAIIAGVVALLVALGLILLFVMRRRKDDEEEPATAASAPADASVSPEAEASAPEADAAEPQAPEASAPAESDTAGPPDES